MQAEILINFKIQLAGSYLRVSEVLLSVFPLQQQPKERLRRTPVGGRWVVGSGRRTHHLGQEDPASAPAEPRAPPPA